MSSRERVLVEEHERNVVNRYMTEIPVRVSAIAKELGISVLAATLPAGVSGELRPSEGTYVVRVNRHDSKARQRFTVAHEIAHYLLHRDQIGAGITDDVLYRSTLSDAREAEANKLAAEIIMPQSTMDREFREKAGQREEVIAQLAEQFQVSEAAMRIRLENLWLI